MNILQLLLKIVKACAFCFTIFVNTQLYPPIRYFLVYKDRTIQNGIFFKQEQKIKVCHSYIHNQIQARKISFWRLHFFII